MKRHTTLFLTALLAFLLTGCIKEDRSDCHRSFTLLFRYEGDGTTDIFRDKVSRVDLYVYEVESRKLLRQYQLNEAELNELQGIRLDDLEPGTYEAVCWGNAFESSGTAVEEHRDQALMAAPEWHAGQDVDTNDELYHAVKTFTITNAYVDQQELCLFNCAHIDLTVRLEGFGQEVVVPVGTRAEGDCPVGLRLENMPGHYDFGMTVLDEETTYRPALAVAADDETAYVSASHTLRFTDDCAAALHLTNPETDETFYTLSISQFLADNDLSVEDHQEVAVDILLRLNTDGVSVTVVPFEDEDIQPGLDERTIRREEGNGYE